MRISDWSSDVCSSDLQVRGGTPVVYLPRVAKDQAELARLVGLRDAARQVLSVPVDGGADDQLIAAQAILAHRYRRTDERRVGQAVGRTRRYRWEPNK